MPDAIAHLDNWGIWLGGVVTGLIALGWAVRAIRRGIKRVLSWARKMDALAELGNAQLSNNHGSSLLDKVERNTRTIDHLEGTVTEMAGTVDTLAQSFDEHLNVQAEANRAMWPAVQAVAEAQPPEHEA